MKRLKRCPFCGHKAIALAWTRDENNLKEFFVECQTCKARGPERYKSEPAKEAWNERQNGSIDCGKQVSKSSLKAPGDSRKFPESPGSSGRAPGSSDPSPV